MEAKIFIFTHNYSVSRDMSKRSKKKEETAKYLLKMQRALFQSSSARGDASLRSARHVLNGASFFSVIIRIKAIAHPGYGEDEARACGIRFNFAAQLADVNMQVMRLGAIASSPHLGE